MSLVNDMLRDLEARRAAPVERERLGDIYAVDETGASRRVRRGWLLRGVLVAAALGLLGAALYQFSSRLMPADQGLPVEPSKVFPAPVEALVTEPEIVTATRLLDVLPQNDGRRFVLQLLLDRPVSYQRTDTAGSVSIRLRDVRFAGEPLGGRIDQNGKTLSWRVEVRNGDVQVLLVGFGDDLSVADRLESAGDQSQLWLEVPLAASSPAEQSLPLPAAAPADLDEAALPEWVTREAPPTEIAQPADSQPAPRAAGEDVAEVREAPPIRPKAVSIGAHQPDALAQARQALARGDHLAALEQLQHLHQSQPDNPEVVRWLARAYLEAGDTAALLKWLPAQLQARPFDAQLRELLARGQLQAGDQAAAIATLGQNAPELQRNLGYHALLAALYQQVGDWTASAATYRQLVAARPNQGAWQLGLAIALEQLDQSAEAGRHYRQALQGQGLDSSAQRFARERASSLGATK